MRDLAAFFADHEEDQDDTLGLPDAESRACPQLTALRLIDNLVPASSVLSCVHNDRVWLTVNPEVLNAVATDDQLLTLIRCGVEYDDDEEGLYFYV